MTESSNQPLAVPPQRRVLRFDTFIYDGDHERLLGPDGEIHLRPQVFRLLGLLLREAPRPVAQQDLIDEIWGLAHVSPSSIQRAVSELRTALDDDAKNPRFIATVHRRGYRFVGEMETEAPTEPTPAASPDPNPPPESEPPVQTDIVAAPAALSDEITDEVVAEEPVRQEHASGNSKNLSRQPPAGQRRALLALGLCSLGLAVGLWLVSTPSESPPESPEHPPAPSASPLEWPIGEPGTALVKNPDIAGPWLTELVPLGGDDPLAVRRRFAALEADRRAAPESRLAMAEALAALGWQAQALELLDQNLADPERDRSKSTGPSAPWVLSSEALRFSLVGEGEASLDRRRTLATLFPDDFEHGLHLAQAERRFGSAERAARALTDLRQAPEPDDLRVAASRRLRLILEDAETAHSQGNMEAMLHIAAQGLDTARQVGSPYREAQFLLLAGRARHHLEQLTAAVADLAAAADLFDRLGCPRGAAESLVTWATLLYEQERLEAAAEGAEKALAAAERLGDSVMIARSRLQLGRIAVAAGDLELGIEHTSRAESLYREAGREIGASASRTTIAQLHYRQGRLERSKALLEESLEVYRRRQRWENVLSATSNLGMVCLELGRVEDAAEFLDEAIAAQERLHPGEEPSPYVRLSLGRSALLRGETDRAHLEAEGALQRFTRLERPTGRLASYQLLVSTMEARGDLAAAWDYLEQAAGLPFNVAPTDSGRRPRLSLTLSRARMSVLLGRLDDAEAMLRSVEDELPQVDDAKLRARLIEGQALLARGRGNARQADRLWTEATESWHTMGRSARETQTRLERARTALDIGDLDAVEALLVECLSRARELGFNRAAAEAWALRAELYRRRGEPETAHAYARTAEETATLRVFHRARLMETRLRLEAAAGNTDAVQAAFDELRAFIEKGHDPRLEARLVALRSELGR